MDQYNVNGWLPNDELMDELVSSLENPYFEVAGSALKGSGKNKSIFLYEAFTKVGIPYPKPLQTSAPDCVSQSCSLAVDTLKVVEILSGQREEFLSRTACEYIYSVSRMLIGAGRLGRGGGSINGWALKGIKQYGVLRRQKYGKVDLTTYSSSRAVDWGNQKLPQTLTDIGKEFNIGEFTQIKNFEQACDSLINGYPIVVASNQGFSRTRDKFGFCRPEGNWNHSMGCTGYKDDSRPAVVINNSWPGYLSGPATDYKLPESSFFCDAETFNKMAARGDTFALCDFNGYQLRDIDTSTW